MSCATLIKVLASLYTTFISNEEGNGMPSGVQLGGVRTQLGLATSIRSNHISRGSMKFMSCTLEGAYWLDLLPLGKHTQVKDF